MTEIYLSKNNRNFIHLKSYFNKWDFVLNKICFLLDSEEIAFPDPAVHDFEGGLLAMGETYLRKESGFAYQNRIFHGLILKMIFCGGVPILDSYYFQRFENF